MKTTHNLACALVLVWSLLLSATAVVARSYTTQFGLTENPISEGGNWINGMTTGGAWHDVKTADNVARGTTGATSLLFNDPTAVVTGSWGSNQTATATVVITNRANDFPEVQLRLRTSIASNSIAGYEIIFSCRDDINCYVQIVRWNGPFGDFDYLESLGGSQYVFQTGDQLKATIVGNTITGYINGVEVIQATDTSAQRINSGSPGIGFYLQGSGGSMEDFGFTSFTATDSVAIPPMPSLSIVGPTSSGVYTLVQSNGVPGTVYKIEYLDTLASTNWVLLGSGTAGTNGLFQLFDTPTNGALRRFYRSRWP